MSEQTNKNKRRGIIVGIFIIVGLIFLLGGVLTIGNLHSTFSRKINVSTVFGDVNGLTAGNNIWFSGVKIGTVKKTEFYGKSQVRVIMNINVDSKEFIRRDAKVKVGTDGLIGNKILVIYGGTSTAPPIEDGDTLGNESMLSTEDIMNTFQQNNKNVLLLTKRLADGEGTVGKLLSNDSIYNNISNITRSLQLAASDAAKLLSGLATFGNKLNKPGTLANQLVTDTVVFKELQGSITRIHSVADTAGVAVNALKRSLTSSTTPVGVLLHDEKAGAELKRTLSNLDTSSAKLNEDLEALQHNFLLRRYFKNKEKDKK